jgi:hypothetical protein
MFFLAIPVAAMSILELVASAAITTTVAMAAEDAYRALTKDDANDD